MRWIVDHLVMLCRLYMLFSVERHARMIDSKNLNDVGRKRAWPVLRQSRHSPGWTEEDLRTLCHDRR
jgi:hypothetical protein